MNLPPNAFKAALREKRKQIGMWVSLADPFAAEIVAGAGFDWLCVDMEHSPGDVKTTLTQLQAIAPYGPAIVRPPWNDTVMIKRLLDSGAPGLLIPMVQNADEARAAVAATRYPPEGVRGMAGTLRGNHFGRITDYHARIADETVVIVQIESLAALGCADEIAAVDGVDGIFFGPADIAADLGLLCDPMNPKVWDAVRPVAQRLNAAGMPVGTLVGDLEFAAELLNAEFTFVAAGTDSGALSKSMDRIVETLRQGIEGKN